MGMAARRLTAALAYGLRLGSPLRFPRCRSLLKTEGPPGTARLLTRCTCASSREDCVEGLTRPWRRFQFTRHGELHDFCRWLLCRFSRARKDGTAWLFEIYGAKRAVFTGAGLAGIDTCVPQHVRGKASRGVAGGRRLAVPCCLFFGRCYVGLALMTSSIAHAAARQAKLCVAWREATSAAGWCLLCIHFTGSHCVAATLTLRIGGLSELLGVIRTKGHVACFRKCVSE